MKKMLFVTIILLLAGSMVYAQQASGSTLPSSAQTKQDAQQYLGQARTDEQNFEALLAELTARNTSNKDLEYFNQLRTEIERLKTSINNEEVRFKAVLDAGQRVDPQLLNRIERLINQHKDKVAELDAFVSG